MGSRGSGSRRSCPALSAAAHLGETDPDCRTESLPPRSLLKIEVEEKLEKVISPSLLEECAMPLQRL